MLPVLWEIIIPLILAVLLGVFIGWLLWRWRRQVITETEWIIAQERIRTLEGDVDSLRVDNERLDASRAAAQVELDDARKTVRGVEADLEGARGEIETLAEAKGAADARVGELDAELSGAKSEAADLTSKLAALSTDLDGARADADAARADADAARAEVDTARGEVDAARAAAAADAEAARAAAAADAEAVKVAAFADLDAAKGDAEAARDATAALQAELDLARAEASSAQAAADAARLDAERAAADAANAKADADAGSAAVIAGLEADLAACRSKVEELEAADDPATNWQVGTTTLGTPGAGHKDDLKVVNGIGPKMESLLNGFGIQSWEQLAWLTPAQVQTVDDALQEFPGRIERDEWVPQANDLIARFPDRADRPTRETFLNRSAE